MNYIQDKQVFRFLVEGKTEKNYITKLNKFFRENHFDIYIQCYDFRGIGNLMCKKIEPRIKEFLTKERKGKVYILLDYDVVKRKEYSTKEIESKIKKEASNKQQLKFLYTYQIFEDFLIMHLDDCQFNNWLDICKHEDHFNCPITGDKIVELINTKKIFKQEYKKGEIPDEIIIDENVISNTLKMRNNKNQFYSDFIDFLVELFNKNIFV